MGTCGDRGVNGIALCYGAYWTTKLQSPIRVSKFTYNLETCDMDNRVDIVYVIQRLNYILENRVGIADALNEFRDELLHNLTVSSTTNEEQ
jgi:hypothetical protein